MPHMLNWAVDYEQHTESNHMLIRFDIETDKNNTVLDPTTNTYNFKKTDWKIFTETLTNDRFDMTWNRNEQDKIILENMTISLRESIQKAIEKSTSKLRIYVRSKA